MSKEFSKHDLIFAKAMEDPEKARILFKEYFPQEVQSYINFDSSEFQHLNPKFTHDVLSGYKVCDVLYKAMSKDGTVLLLIHGEHQSLPDETIALRAIVYAMMAVLAFHLENPNSPLPPILSIIYYNGKKPYTHSMDPLALFNHVPEKIRSKIFKPMLIDLTQQTDQELATHGALASFETLMKHAQDKTTDEKMALFVDALSKTPHTEEDSFKTGSFFRSLVEYAISCIGQSKKEPFLNRLSRSVNKEVVMSIADELRQEGILEGILEGIREVAKKSLSKGFDVETVAEITGLDVKKIEEIKKTLH